MRIMHQDLYLFPYKIQILHLQTDANKAERRAFEQTIGLSSGATRRGGIWGIYICRNFQRIKMKFYIRFMKISYSNSENVQKHSVCVRFHIVSCLSSEEEFA